MRASNRFVLFLLVHASIVTGCVGSDDDPSQLRDLRVVAMRFDPPEIALNPCNPVLFAALSEPGASERFDAGLSDELIVKALGAVPMALTVLVGDPKGEGRSLDYRLRVCSDAQDRQCLPGLGAVELAHGTMTAGENTIVLSGASHPAQAILPDEERTPMLVSVLQKDAYRGLGGIRVPLVLELSSPDGAERILAQKLMIYSCQFLPGQTTNVAPVLQGFTARGETWNDDAPLDVKGSEEIAIDAADFSRLEEDYVVAGFDLKPIPLHESWKLSWLTTQGRMSEYQTGGTDFAGQSGRHRVKWIPNLRSGESEDVFFYVVARDGRGGTSWVSRRARLTPR